MITRLYDEVWMRERCAGCGMCVAACSKQVLFWDDLENPRLRKVSKNIGLSKFDLDTCSFCQKFCEQVCPRLEPAARLQPLDQFSARASGVLGGGDPNDVARNLLIAARGGGIIDGALMVDAERGGRTRARVVTSAGEIAEVAGFQQVWTPLLDALNEAIFVLGLKNLALVSTPCAAQAVRRLLDSTSERLEPYRRSIRLNMAMFCTGVFERHSLQEMLADGMHLTLENVQRLVVSPREGKLYAWLWDGGVREMSLTEVEPFTRAGCARCDDFLGESADLAMGAAGALDGYSTVIVRSGIGQAVVQNALTMKLLESIDQVDRMALDRASAEKDRRERAQAFDRLHVLMLDALRDPRKRSEVKQTLNLLYGAPRPMSRKEDSRNAGCGDCSGC